MPANRNRNFRQYGRMNMNNSNQSSGGQDYGSGGSRALLASSGPLVTNHLQLQELDLELALLKRKREMIEKQHTMLVSEPRFGGSSQYGFNQASESYGSPRPEPTRNFANFYNDTSSGTQYGRFNTQQGVKRPAIDPWDNSNSTPKHFNAPSGPKKPARYDSRAPRSQPASQPPPLMSSSFRPRRPAPVASRNNPRLSRVTKPRQSTAPNKLNSYPVAERKNLVSKATGLVQKTPETFIYEADKPMNPKLLGRLELALGSILREMREQYGAVEPHVLTFANIAGLRAVKQAIRERIRIIMLGKPVGAGAEIVASYRKEHPKDTDLELLDTARKSIVHKDNLAIEIIKQGNPERYFRSNFKRLLDASLKEMFERMECLYNNVENTGKPLQEVIDGMLLDMQNTLKDEPKEEPEENTQNNESQASENIKTEKSVENGAKVESESDVKESESDVKESENVTNSDEKDVKSEDTAVESENVDIPEQKDIKPVENAEKVAESGAGKPTRVMSHDECIRAKFYGRIMDSLMKRNLPIILPKYKELILKILGTEKAFKETKAYLIKSTNEKVDGIEANKPATSTPAKPPTGPKNSLFVKVVGRPCLPKKKLMKAFLDTFHPTLIKKHRNMHNILFVSFDNQENVDNILAKNGEIIASCQLNIRTSERINKPNPETQTENNDQQDATTNNDDDIEIIDSKHESIKLDDTLDDQISDLLSSIREEDEKKDVSENGEDVKLETSNEGDSVDKIDTANKVDDEEENKLLNETVDEAEKQDEEMANTETNEATLEPEATPDPEATPEPEETPESEVTSEPVPIDDAVKNEAAVKGTPTRSSARLTATPSTIRTRRASKLAQNN